MAWLCSCGKINSDNWTKCKNFDTRKHEIVRVFFQPEYEEPFNQMRRELAEKARNKRSKK